MLKLVVKMTNEEQVTQLFTVRIRGRPRRAIRPERCKQIAGFQFLAVRQLVVENLNYETLPLP